MKYMAKFNVYFFVRWPYYSRITSGAKVCSGFHLPCTNIVRLVLIRG